ncbi:MAG: tetratricopeptide repeat protein [Thermodesulfovibrionales bacterium]
MRAFKCAYLFLIFFMIASFHTHAMTQTNVTEVYVAQNLSVIQLVHKSREFMATNDITAALRYARAAVSVDPAYAESWKQLGRILMLKGDYDEALSSLQTANELKPDDKEIPEWILRSLMAKDNINELVNRLLTMKESDISRFDTHMITALISSLIEKPDVQNALKIITLWERKALLSGDRQAATGLRQILQDNLTDAIKTLTSVNTTSAETYPLLALAWTRIGIQYLGNNEIADSINAFHQALKFQPNWIPALRELGWALRRDGKPSDAADTWEQGLKNDPRLTNWLSWIVEARIEAGQVQDAYNATEHLLQSDPRNVKARADKLMLLLLQNKENQVHQYEIALKKEPDGEFVIALSHVLADIHAGHYAEAASQTEKIIQTHPDDKELQEVLAKAYAGWASHENPRDALYPLQKLVVLKPSAGTWRDLGWSLWENGQHEEAINAWETALRNEIKNRDRLIKQVVARLAEEGYSKKALELYSHWYPDKSFLPLGLTLFTETRYIAARELLSAAWDAGEDPVQTGIHLAYTEARSGTCGSVYRHLTPFVEHGIVNANPAHIDLFLSTIHSCSLEPNLSPLILKLEATADSLPAYAKRINDILEKAAAERKTAGDLESALELYKRLMYHDPDRVDVWFQAVRILDTLKRQQDATIILNDILNRTSSQAVSEGIKGKLADYKDDPLTAVKHYQNSLIANQDQPDLRFYLFKDLLTLRQFDNAFNESKWFADRVSSGDNTLKSYLAETLTALGKMSEAFTIWQELHLTYPENPHYAVETAKGLFLQCRAGDAIAILEQLLKNKPYLRGFELMAEIETSLNHPERVLKWTTEGLKYDQSNTRLLQYRAETAEAIGETAIAQEAAEALLKLDKGNVPASLIAGQALLNQNRLEDAKKYYEALRNRNALFLPSLIHLREIASYQNKTHDALEYAKDIAEQRPWDISSSLRKSLSLAEDDRFPEALKTLREITNIETIEAVPLLIYNNVTQCPYPGYNSTKQVSEHLRFLKDKGFIFITLEQLSDPMLRDKHRIIIVLTKTDESALREIDKTMQHINGRAIYACDSDSLTKNIPGGPDPSLLKELEKSDRWIIAWSGAPMKARTEVDASDTLGNPLTHRIMSSHGKENVDQMTNRLDTFFSATSKPLKSSNRIFLYPAGDYGQLSLDTGSQDIEILQNVTQRYFDFAIAADDNGFVVIPFDTIRLSGRYVPARWGTNELLNLLTRKNPLVLARLELAKVLNWQSQHEQANKWFRRAESSGADPKEVTFHWGNNAYLEGDLPTALNQIRTAQKLDPASSKINKALERALNRKRPLLEFSYDRWNDSDDREYESYGGKIEGHINDRLQLGLSIDRNKWDREGFGDEKGTRIGGELLWYFQEEHWINANIWYMNLDHIKDHAGGSVNVHFPNAPWSGFVELQAGHEEIDTVEAVRKRIMSNRYAIQTYSRILDVWDLFANLTTMSRTDRNDSLIFNGRFVRRLKEWPFLGIGYQFRFADSERSPVEYWAPQDLQQHELYFASRGEYQRLSYNVIGNVGYADEKDNNWRFVWGTKAELNIHITSRLLLNARYKYQESPNYNLNEWLFGASYRF